MPAKIRVELQPAYILHQKPYRDSSALVELVTPEFGRITLVANGVKRAKSKWQGHLRAFQPMLVSWTGRSELMTLTHVEISGKPLHMPSNYIVSGFYLNEIMLRLLHRLVPQVEIFSSYDITLRKIAAIDEGGHDASLLLQSYLRYFEVNLLHALGYGITLDVDADSGHNVQADETYEFLVDHGPKKLCDGARESEFSVRVGGKTLLALAQQSMMVEPIDQSIFHDSKRLMRTILARYLGEKPLVSREIVARKKRLVTLKTT